MAARLDDKEALRYIFGKSNKIMRKWKSLPYYGDTLNGRVGRKKEEIQDLIQDLLIDISCAEGEEREILMGRLWK